MGVGMPRKNSHLGPPHRPACRFTASFDLQLRRRLGTMNHFGRARLLPSPNFRPRIRAPRERRPTRFMGRVAKSLGRFAVLSPNIVAFCEDFRGARPSWPQHFRSERPSRPRAFSPGPHRCGQDGRAPVGLRLCRAAPWRLGVKSTARFGFMLGRGLRFNARRRARPSGRS